MADISNSISEEALAEWFKETYEQASPGSVEERAYREASDKKAFRQCKMKQEGLDRLMKEAQEEAGEDAEENDIDDIFYDKCFAPENDFIFDAIHPGFLLDKYNSLVDDISVMEEGDEQVKPLAALYIKIQERIDQLINDYAQKGIIDPILVEIHINSNNDNNAKEEATKNMGEAYEEMMDYRADELKDIIENADFRVRKKQYQDQYNTTMQALDIVFF